MKRLLKLYYYRLKKETSFWVIFGLIGGAGLLLGIIVGAYYGAMGENERKWIDLASFTLVGFTTSSSLASLTSAFSTANIVASSMAVGFWGLIVITLFIGREWKERTFRNQILAGNSRVKIYFSSYIVTISIALANLLVFIIAFLLGGSLFGVPYFSAYYIENIAGYVGTYWASFFMLLLVYLMFASAATSWSYIIPNSWGALGLFYASIVFITIVGTIVTVLGERNHMPVYLFMNFLPDYQTARLTAMSFDTAVTGYAKEVSPYGYITYTSVVTEGHATSFVLTTVFSNLFYIALMDFLGCLSFVKRDLK